ncbi:MAG: hypothetical protein IJQ20_02745 [Paludibacteraceae bacterium]|nr:hypothetical protein [Paludibacteraceae bacterium]MBQ6983827.1 hypothetical protein [Paludibacteraceae bacterium]
MKELEVRIDDAVFFDLTEFYKFSLKKHPTLDEATVLKKEQRLIRSLKALGKYALTDHTEIRHIPWIRKGYKDYYADGFHFGYKIEALPSGENVVVVYEALHELLFD